MKALAQENTTQTNMVVQNKNQLSVRPRTFYQDLAESGSLFEFVQSNMNELYHSDPLFRKQILGIILQHAPATSTDFEVAMLQELSDALDAFRKGTEQCRIV